MNKTLKQFLRGFQRIRKMFDKLNKPDIELDAFKCQGKHYKNVHWSTCKRDLIVVRDRDETETFDFQSETRLRHSNFFTRPRRLELRLETETSRPRLHPWEKE